MKSTAITYVLQEFFINEWDDVNEFSTERDGMDALEQKVHGVKREHRLIKRVEHEIATTTDLYEKEVEKQIKEENRQ
jgi:hypothetical protein